ncbi:MAG: M23 family metallopeptidase [Clostridia bacterium]|nr:M23 family metallopeptidase [Clostridia bacterium]
MDENRTREKKKTEKEKDFYSTVIVCQFFLCLILVGTLFLLDLYGGNFGSAVTEKISVILSQSSSQEDISSAVGVIREFFSGESLSVFGTSVTDYETTSEKAETTLEDTKASGITEEYTTIPMGGEDLQIFEATEKTSFSPYVTTDKLLNPIENGRYTSYFGYRTNPITGEWSFHTGLDIAAAQGTKIRSALSGTVTTVGEDSRAGKYIIVTHSQGFQTFYCHCSEILAEEGMNLNKGETVALVGSTGWSTGPHLHFEVRRNGIRLNPLWALENDC